MQTGAGLGQAHSVLQLEVALEQVQDPGAEAALAAFVYFHGSFKGFAVRSTEWLTV